MTDQWCCTMTIVLLVCHQ